MSSKRSVTAMVREYLPVLLMTIGGACFVLMDTFAKLLVEYKGIPVAPIVFSRMLVTAILASSYMNYQRMENPFLGPPGVRIWLFVRGFFDVANIYLFYACLEHISLSDAMSLWFMAPIITSMVAALFLHEPYTLFEGTCGAISFVGVLLVTRPSMLFGSTGVKSSNQVLGFLQVGGSMLSGVMMFIIARHVGQKCDTMFFVSYSSYIAVVGMGAMMIMDHSQRPNMANFDLPATAYLTGLSVTGFLAMYMQNKAIQLAKVGRITLLLYLQLPLIVGISWAVFGDLMTLLSMMGCLIIVGCAVAITLNKEQQETEKGGDTAGYDRLVQGDGDIELPLSATSVRTSIERM